MRKEFPFLYIRACSQRTVPEAAESDRGKIVEYASSPVRFFYHKVHLSQLTFRTWIEMSRSICLKKYIYLDLCILKEMMFDMLVASDLFFLPIHLIQGGKVEKELGIIWPTHITRRPDSDFKQRLIKALTKPVAPKEFYRLFDVVTTRTPLMKLRQVRNETKLYPAEEMGKSYLEHYPGTVLQGLHTSCL